MGLIILHRQVWEDCLCHALFKLTHSRELDGLLHRLGLGIPFLTLDDCGRVIKVSQSLLGFSSELSLGEGSGAGLSGGLGDLVGDSVHVLDSLSGELLTDAGLLAFLSHNVDFLDELGTGHLLEAVSDVLSRSDSRVLLASTVSGTTTVMLAHAEGSDLSLHVELVHDGGSSGVEPVIIIRGELLPGGGLNVNNPLGHLDEVLFLKVLSEASDEILSGYVLNGRSVNVDEGEVLLHNKNR